MPLTRRCILALAVLVLAGASTADGPTRGDFFNELLACGGTSQTSKFHSYYDHSFVVRPMEVLEEFPRFARASGAKLRALVIMGPSGGLWTYRVLTFLEEGDAVRCNSLVMPHARILEKSSGLFTEEEVGRFLTELRSFPRLASVDPGVPRDFVVADFASTPPAVRFGIVMEVPTPEEVADAQAIVDFVRRELRTLKLTYERRKRGRYARFPCPSVGEHTRGPNR